LLSGECLDRLPPSDAWVASRRRRQSPALFLAEWAGHRELRQVMFKLDCHARSAVGAEHLISGDRFFIADLVPPDRTNPVREGHATQFGGGGRRPRSAVEPERGDPTCVMTKMFGVAHGVDGLPAAERASEIVAETARDFVATHYSNHVRWRPESVSCTLTAVPAKCAQALSNDVARNPWQKGLGSTLTLAQVVWPRLHLMHVGDCRCYLSRSGQIMRLTSDQITDGTLAQRGVVPNDGQGSVRRRTVWSFIADGGETVKPQVTEVDLQLGDTLVLCTSGLVKDIPDEQIAELLNNDPPAEDACRRLVQAAQERGGQADMTVIVVRFREA
jgi:PPM family protein phosphatase